MNKTMRTSAALCAVAGLLLAGCSTNTEPSSGQSDSESGAQSDSATADSGGTCKVSGAGSAVVGDAQSGATAEELANISNASLETVELSGNETDAPTVAFESPLDVPAEAVLVAQDGTGDPIADGQVVSINYMVCDVVTGEKLYSTWGRDAELSNPVSMVLSEGNFGPSVVEALQGASVGTRFLWAQPGYSAEESLSGVASNGYLYVMSIDGAQDLPDSASGKDVTPSDDTLPVVTFTDEKPTIQFPEAFSDPSELIAQPLIEGDGATVEAGQTIAVKYAGWLTNGTQFDSSWDREAPDDVFMFNVGEGSVIEGWDSGLVGQKVGSRVLLVIPSDMGYGATGSGDTIPADSTLVFVVDILAAF